ncbi:MAG: sugar phosphate isomerase/epimerase family protein [Phycisphaerales bacterium]
MSRVGVCSWSLQPASPTDLADKVRACGLDAVQLALDPLRTGQWSEADTARALKAAGITICSGMMAFRGEDYSTLESIRRTGGVRPDLDWPENLDAAEACARLAERLGLALVTFHAGFIPHEAADPVRGIMIDRLRHVVDAFSARGVRVALETGQESAQTLLDALAELDRPLVGANFDPANMILYAMGDPVASLRLLARAGRVAQVHIKDALPTRTPGTWGEETPAGAGAVDWPAFFRVLREHAHTPAHPLACDLVIERESGGTRLDDVRAAAALVRSHLAPPSPPAPPARPTSLR